MSQIQLPIQFGIKELPSPKMNRTRIETSPWPHFLAAFSEEFACEALKLLMPAGKGVLYDPFVGSGTSTTVASALGIRAFGNDLNPISALISRAKLCRKVDLARCKDFLRYSRKKNLGNYTANAALHFTNEDLAFATVVFDRLRKSVGGDRPFITMIEDTSGDLDSEILALASLILASKVSAKVVMGTNPVWFKTAHPNEVISSPRLIDVSQKKLESLVAKLNPAASRLRPNIKILCDDARNIVLRRNSVDCVLTSPPYLNRLDYIVNSGSELLLLSGFEKIDIRQIRTRMTGTALIGTKQPPVTEVGETCLKTLNQIKKHTSKASETYYYPFFVNYFNDMFRVFQSLRVQCKKGATGLMVVQNSYYKEKLIPSALIFEEMAENAGFRIDAVGKQEVRTHLGQLSPKQMAYVPGKKLHEWVLRMTF